MTTVDTDFRSPDEVLQSNPEHLAVDALVESVAGVTLEHANSEDIPNDKINTTPPRPLKVYTRSQVLYLHKSPLVKPPEGMPALKDWFGDWNEQFANKKDPESSSPSTNTRDRRFRRDPEDAEASGRPSFRSTLSQPSQMGNFRHQSLRTNDRDKDRDTERERERDLRDKEGQERLRNLSDKYDRERLGISSSSSNLRHKERESAPHLASSTSSRLGQTQGSTTTARRTDGRDAPKRKTVEISEDWRRGPEPSRARDDRSDNSRKDRDNRDRPRSRVRDSSRSRRDTSTCRRERDRDRDEKGRERVPDRRGDGDRDEHRRDKDDHLRREWDDFHNRDREKDDHYSRDPRDKYEHSRHPRDTDRDRDLDDDPRRWRDDGKRDERVAARRERDRPWDRYDDRDRERPAAADDRDARTRRGNGRDRRLADVGEDGKDRGDRRERERDREAEPAWMETYVPTTPNGGILGAKTGDGELDGIQAWKKGMKEKERKEKETDSSQDAAKKAETMTVPAPSSATESPLDEIQLFKLLMKREAEKKDVERPWNGQLGSTPPRGDSSPSHSSQEQFKGSLPLKGDTSVATSRDTQADSIVSMHQALDASSNDLNRQTRGVVEVERQPQPEKPSAPPLMNGSQTLLSTLISTQSGDSSVPSHLGKSPILDIPQERSRVMSRVLSNASSSAVSSVTHSLDASPVDQSVHNSSAPSTFNPPPGSRLLAFGSRQPSGSSEVPSSKSHHSLDPALGQIPPPVGSVLSSHRSGNLPSFTSANHPMGNIHQAPESMSGLGPDAHYSATSKLTPSDSTRINRNYSPQRNISQPSFQFEDMHDAALGQINDPLRHSSITAVERAAFGLPVESGTPYVDLGGGPPGMNYSSGGSFDLNGVNVPGANYATSKGSRFAKFFDSKTRDGQVVGVRKGPSGPGYVSTSPHPGQRQEVPTLNGMVGNNPDTRTMEDIFAMLQSSAQNHRLSPQIPQPGRIPPGGTYGQNHPDLHMLQQHQQQLHASQQFAQNNHLDSLYDSRLDDRNFMPDGMVPGLRPVPPRSRSREPSGVLFNEQLDDPLHFNVQRIAQQRNLEHMYSGPVPSVYSQQAGMMRNGGLPMQQGQFRGGPSPIPSQPSLQGPPQRLPPGLANLGGRPPHDPSQFVGGPVGGGIHGGLHGGSPAQAYNNFNGGGLGYGGGTPQIRGPPIMNSVANLALQSTLDLRAANQAQLLQMGGGGLRGAGPGFGPQHVPPSQIPSSHMPMRQQQQQQQQHIPPHLLPPHIQQQQQQGGAYGQATQDLMALLMGGHRD